MKRTLNMLKMVTSEKPHICLWCREVIVPGEAHYHRKGRTSYYRYHSSCVNKAIRNNYLDGLLLKEA